MTYFPFSYSFIDDNVLSVKCCKIETLLHIVDLIMNYWLNLVSSLCSLHFSGFKHNIMQIHKDTLLNTNPHPCSCASEMERWMEDIRMAIDLAEQSSSPHTDLLSTSPSDNSESVLYCMYRTHVGEFKNNHNILTD